MTSVPDTDATALAVILLGDLDSADPDVRQGDRSRGQGGSSGTQKRNGTFGGGTSTAGAEHQQHGPRGVGTG